MITRTSGHSTGRSTPAHRVTLHFATCTARPAAHAGCPTKIVRGALIRLVTGARGTGSFASIGSAPRSRRIMT
jgi:hypothetical protein